MLPHALTIAGSDSGGGAGIQADLKTFLALGAYGMSVITALTAQNTRGVAAIHTPPASFVTEQFESISSDIRIDGIKIGMLANAQVARATADVIQKWRASGAQGTVILDPVMVSTSGSLLLEHDAIETVVRELLPICSLVTPNLAEAVQISRHAGSHAEKPTSLSCILRLAQTILGLGPPAILLKGGHNMLPRDDLEKQLEELGLHVKLGVSSGDAVATDEPHSCVSRESDATSEHLCKSPCALEKISKMLGGSHYTHGPLSAVVVHGPGDIRVLSKYADSVFDSDRYTVDVFADAQSTVLFVKPMVRTSATHGTGCTLSAAICAYAARGLPLGEAVAGGIQYLQETLASSIENLGSGSGPLDHGAHAVQRAVPARSPRVPAPLSTLLISRSWDKWCTYTRHPFTARMGRGTLSPHAFVWYLRQDYIYLRHYARIWAKAASDPSCQLQDIGRYAQVSQLAVKETEMHIALCAEWGVSREELEATTESRATRVYTRSMLDNAAEGLLPLLVAVASCALGYAEVGLWLASTDYKASPYRKWIDEYSGRDFLESVKLIIV
ncbi:trifunctional hydroxymethylpyrimidine kinase/phosphomethylpyrimidine kinase/thiaminase [Malassezia cuniculi]|uniref:Trifunctional hydroxymethylpyrimidine kinase/phosphomethylpyrimidine kinase/thiaminase n=1 Tax=Malassezia cuniculi TaxID=948313 RepID=A0AAF0EU28_9BASI|nr:trifunctional hydroxymethylpyrimidine kinase/phosphomethylpyrimidine kinase/thiaminase [Malassezia cuniculi]